MTNKEQSRFRQDLLKLMIGPDPKATPTRLPMAVSYAISYLLNFCDSVHLDKWDTMMMVIGAAQEINEDIWKGQQDGQDNVQPVSPVGTADPEISGGRRTGSV